MHAAKNAQPDLAPTIRQFSGVFVESIVAHLHQAVPMLPRGPDRTFGANLLATIKRNGIELPGRADVFLELQRIMMAPEWRTNELVRVVERDATITAKFLAVANGPKYNRTFRVTSLRDAIVRVGAEETTFLLMGIMAQAKLFNSARRAEARQLYRRSLGSALAMRHLSQSSFVDPNEAFTIGLVHDLGAIWVLNQVKRTDGVSRKVIHRLATLLHEDLGALIAQAWGFDVAAIFAIRHHHGPEVQAKLPPTAPPGEDEQPAAERATELRTMLVRADAIAEAIVERRRIPKELRDVLGRQQLNAVVTYVRGMLELCS